MTRARPAHPAPWAGLAWTALLIGALVWASPSARAAGPDAQDLFRDGDYAAALRALAGHASAMRPGEEILWRSRLADGVPQALALLQGILGERGYPQAIQARIAMEAAELEAGRGRPQAALAALEPLLRRERNDVPGSAHLRAGLALRAAGSLQRARESLALVKSGDPAYPLARFHLGDIALDLGDPQSAVGYFQELVRSGGPEVGVFAEGGLWRALRAAGRDSEAQRVLERLEGSHPECLPLMEIRHHLQRQGDALAAQARGNQNAPGTGATATDPASAAVPAGATDAASGEGRYCLQFGAFSDRRLAMDFQERHRERVPDLRIDRVQGAQGQYVYKVRAGSFPNAALARAQAVRLRATLGLDVFVTELEAGAIAQE